MLTAPYCKSSEMLQSVCQQDMRQFFIHVFDTWRSGMDVGVSVKGWDENRDNYILAYNVLSDRSGYREADGDQCFSGV